jgi:hypothetical protein
MTLIEVANKIYSESWEDSEYIPLCRNFLLNRSKEILSFDSTDFIKYNMENFYSGYCIHLLLCLPELWLNFSLQKWLSLSKSINRNKNYKLMDANEATFDDIKFLCKYIGLNLLPIYTQDKSLDISIRSITLDFFKKQPYLLVNNKDDNEFIKSEYCNTKKIIDDYSKKLKKEHPNLSIKSNNIDNIEKMLNQIKISYLLS